MAKSLPLVSELLESSWALTKKHWEQNLHTSLGYIGLSLISFFLAYLSYATPLGHTMILRIVDFIFIQLLGNIWVTMRLTQHILHQDSGAKGDAAPISWRTYGLYLWTSILSSLAVIGGLFVFFLPGIWLSILLSFSGLIFLEDKIHGPKALAASAALVRGRWWKTLWLLFSTTVLVLILFAIISWSLNLLLSLFVGYNVADLIDQVGATYWWSNLPKGTYLAIAANQAIGAVAVALFTPLLVTTLVKIFHALKETV